MNELEEFPHLIPGERIPSHTVVDHHTGQFKAEGILVQDIIIYRQLESRLLCRFPSLWSLIRNSFASDVFTSPIFFPLKSSFARRFFTN